MRVLAIIAILAAGVYIGARPSLQGDFLADRITLPRAALFDQTGTPQRIDGDDALVVMTFAYTTCGSICPVANTVMAELDVALGPAPQPPVRLMTVTIDPANDTPALMAEAAAAFGASPNWLWLTGAPPDVDRLLRAVGADASDIVLHDPLFLIGRPSEGRFYRSRNLPEAPDLLALVQDLR